MDQGCPNEGKDTRLWGRVTCFLQRLGTFKCSLPPPFLRLEFAGVRIGIPIGAGRYFLVRSHLWRYDYYAKEYIFFSGMAKRVSASELEP